MKSRLAVVPFMALLMLAPSKRANADFFYPISSVSTNTTNDLFPVGNLIQGAGSGFSPAEPHLAGGTGPAFQWVTEGPTADYYTSHPAPILTFDLGQDRPLTEISTWGYASSNANGVKDFSLRFATAAEGLAGFGSSIPFNPTYNMLLDPLPRQSFSFGQTVTARYVELTAVDNYFGGGPPGGDRVGMGEVAFESPPPPPPPLPMGTGILVPTLLSSTNANPFDVATPAKLTDNSGMSPAVNEGDSLGAALAATHVFGGFAESWVTNNINPDYFAGGAGTPTFLWDLKTDVNLDAIVLWTYQNDGGGNPDGAGFRVGNQARTVELQFNTAAQGSENFDGPTTTIFMAPEFGAPNDAHRFGLADTARYVLMRVTDNHFGDPDGFGVHPSIGGDRVGIGEVRFHGTVVPEPGTAVLAAIALAGLLAVRLRRGPGVK